MAATNSSDRPDRRRADQWPCEARVVRLRTPAEKHPTYGRVRPSSPGVASTPPIRRLAMKALLISGLTLVLLTGGAFAQASGPRPAPPTQGGADAPPPPPPEGPAAAATQPPAPPAPGAAPLPPPPGGPEARPDDMGGPPAASSRRTRSPRPAPTAAPAIQSRAFPSAAGRRDGRRQMRRRGADEGLRRSRTADGRPAANAEALIPDRRPGSSGSPFFAAKEQAMSHEELTKALSGEVTDISPTASSSRRPTARFSPISGPRVPNRSC